MKLIITNITCVSACSGIKADNVFLIIQADGNAPTRYPIAKSFPMSGGSSMPLPPVASSTDSDPTTPTNQLVVEFDHGVVITAWDRDSFVLKQLDSPDYLFNINVCSGSDQADTTYTSFNHNGATYSFERKIS